jgi:hypothetical protein
VIDACCASAAAGIAAAPSISAAIKICFMVSFPGSSLHGLNGRVLAMDVS